MNRTEEKLMEKTLDKKVYKGLELQPIYSIQTVLNLGRYQNQESYESSLRFGNMEFFSENIPTRVERIAQRQAVKNAYDELSGSNWKFDSESTNSKGTEKGESLVNMDINDCGKYFTDDTLAMLFKDLVRHVSIRKSIKIDRYTVSVCREGGFTGYIAKLNFNGETFKSLGVMVDENQAKQSAAEICLRKLGYLPAVKSEDDLLIQPYRGGLPLQVNGVTTKKPYIFTSTLSSDVLQAFIYSRGMMQPPKYYVKEVESQSDKEESTCHGEPEKNMECVCYIDGKLFKTSTPHTSHIAIQLAADEAIKYFGISYPHESMELRKHIHLYRYDFYREAYLLCDRQPSKIKSWVWTRFSPPKSYHENPGGINVAKAMAKSGVVMSNLPSWEYQQEIIKGEIAKTPSFKGDKLSELYDVCVGEIDGNNLNLLTIGNSNFSIKMLCREDGTIYCKRRKCNVEILPGHNIRKLQCQYRASPPSLEVHLKAIDCHDLYYLNPPKPVVTSCGVVVLFHDYSASSTDIHVLLQQRTGSSTFVMKIYLLKAILTKLIQPFKKLDFTPADYTEGIVNWKQEEVKLLSEMTMDSVCSVMSNHIEYDTRWNELFARRELPDQLKEIQDICLNELKRREEKGPSEEVVSNTTPWELPQSEFMSRFESVGIHLEESKLCGMRALAESTGMKISLGDIEKCSTVDIPVVDEEKQQRGAVSRYYIWNQVEKGTLEEKDIVTEKLDDGYKLFDKRVIEHGKRRYIYTFDENKRKKYLRNIQYLNPDGTSMTTFYKSVKKNAQVGEDSRDESMNVNGISQDSEITAAEERANHDGLINLDKSDLPNICLPEDPGFESYKNSLKQYCSLKQLGIPKYRRYKRSGKLNCSVTFASCTFNSQEKQDRIRLEEQVAKSALKAFGCFSGTAENELPNIPERFESYKKRLKQYCSQKQLGIPVYSRNKQGGKLNCFVTFASYVFNSQDGTARQGIRLDEEAAKTALKALGYFNGTSENGGAKEDDKVEEVDGAKEEDKVEGVDPYSITTEVIENNESMEDVNGSVGGTKEDGKVEEVVGAKADDEVEEVGGAKEDDKVEEVGGAETGEMVEEVGGAKADDEVEEVDPYSITTEDIENNESMEDVNESVGGAKEDDTVEEVVGAKADDNVEEVDPSSIITEEVENNKSMEDVDESVGGGKADDEVEEVELPNIFLPEHPGFVSYKESLVQYCSLKQLGIPKYNRNRQGGKLNCFVTFASYAFTAQGDTARQGEAEAAKKALKSFGYLSGISEMNGGGKADDEVEEVDPYSITTEETVNKDISMEDANESVGADKEGEVVDESIQVNNQPVEDGSVDVEIIEDKDAELTRSQQEEVLLKVYDRTGNKDEAEQTGNKRKNARSRQRKRKAKKMKFDANDKVNPATDEIVPTKTQRNKEKKLLSFQRKGKTHYPPRDAFRQQCVWMTLDEAIDVCPMLKKIAETAQFQEQLNKLVLEANKFLECKNIKESVKTYLLPVT